MARSSAVALLFLLAVTAGLQLAAATDSKKDTKALKHKICEKVKHLSLSKCDSGCCFGTSDWAGSKMDAVCKEDEAKKADVYAYCCKARGPVDDPIFHDFVERSFEFLGQAGKIFNIITEKSHIVNMGLAPAGAGHIRKQEGEGTFADKIALKLDDTKILVQANEAGDMSVSINDEEQDTDQAFSVKEGDVMIGFSPTTPNVGEGLEIQTKLFTFYIHAIRAFDDEISGHNRGHLNMATTVKSTPGDMEGILGSSLYLAQTGQKSDSDHSFSDEGYEEEYAVGDVFEGLEIKTTSASRRRLIEGSPFAGVAFPITAHYM